MEAVKSELSVGTIPIRVKIGLIVFCLACVLALLAVLVLRYANWILVAGYWNYLLLVTVSSLVLTVIHEGLHALFFKIFGGTVSFGAKWTKLGPAFYATSPKGFAISQYRVIGLAPQILTIVSIALWLIVPSTTLSLAFIVMAIMNFGGGCFDIYSVLWLRKFPKEYLVQDTKDGLRVLG
jgi:hypothetical protein